MLEYSDKYKPQQITWLINDKIIYGEETNAIPGLLLFLIELLLNMYVGSSINKDNAYDFWKKYVKRYFLLGSIELQWDIFIKEKWYSLIPINLDQITFFKHFNFIF